MINTKSQIAVSNPSPGITLTLESTGVIFGICVSAIIVATFVFQIVSKINNILTSISQIELSLKEQSENADKIRKLERTLDLHIQEYINRKDVIQMVLGQLDQKINHKFKRLLFYTRDVQRYLQKDTDFSIREYEETTQEE